MSKPIPNVSRYMTTTPESIAPDARLLDAQRMMQSARFRHLPVLEGETLVGVLSDRDVALILSLQGADASKLLVSDAMTPKPVTFPPTAPLDEVVATMAETKIGSVMIVDHDKVVGIFTATDAMAALAELLQTRLAKS